MAWCATSSSALLCSGATSLLESASSPPAEQQDKETMASLESASDVWGLIAIALLVAANGFFVAAEFSLVSVRRSRVTELLEAKRTNAGALKYATDHLDANLAATQLGITISSLALGWIGEPALAHLIAPLLRGMPETLGVSSSHAIAVALSFAAITTLHIVLGELAPKSLALQRSEGTALWVVRPLALFQMLFRPAIFILNGLGNQVLRLFGLGPGSGEHSFHSREELKLLVAESQEAGLLNQTQQELVERVLNIGERKIAEVMTPRRDVEWIDADDSPEEILRTLRARRHEQLLVGRANIDEPLGMILKKDVLDQILDGRPLQPMEAIREPVVVHETSSIFRVLERFKSAPVRLAMVIDEYGVLQGIVTQTDLLEAIAGELPGVDGQDLEIVEREDGSLLIDGMTPAREAFVRLGFRQIEIEGKFHTIAGFAIAQLGRLPEVGDHFTFEHWRFEIIGMDGRRISRMRARRDNGAGP
jgi:CBS domain containing-hemolysin-like protein